MRHKTSLQETNRQEALRKVQALNAKMASPKTPKKYCVTLAKRGIAKATVDARTIHVPDLWHIAQTLRENPQYLGSQCHEAVLDCWHLCHDLLQHIQEQ